MLAFKSVLQINLALLDGLVVGQQISLKLYDFALQLLLFHFVLRLAHQVLLDEGLNFGILDVRNLACLGDLIVE